WGVENIDRDAGFIFNPRTAHPWAAPTGISPAVAPAITPPAVKIAEHLARAHRIADGAVRRGAIGCHSDALRLHVRLNSKAQPLGVQGIAEGGWLVDIGHVLLSEGV